MLAAGLFLFSLMFLSACATQEARDLESALPAAIEQSVELKAVPFFAQADFQCGPAALAMALQAAGRQVTPEELEPQVYLPGRQGSLQAEMMAGARRQGMVALRTAPRLADLLQEVAAGHPVIVLQNLGLEWIPVWHYSVVIGYDLSRGQLVLRSGLAEREEISFSTFDRTWARGQRWGMMALAPGDLPAAADPDAYVTEVVKLEKTHAHAARTAYQSVVRAYPDHYLALMGLGNTAYGERDLPSAIAAYRNASRVRPDSAAAFNNLAQALFEFGQPREALAMARVAVGIGGPLQKTAMQTRQSIEAALAKGRPSPPALKKMAPAVPR